MDIRIARTLLFISLLLIVIFISLILYCLINKEINKRKFQQIEKITKSLLPEEEIKNLKIQNMKNVVYIKNFSICILICLCIIFYFIGKKVENNVLSEIIPIAIEKHNTYYSNENRYIKNIYIKKEDYLLVIIEFEESGKKYIEQQAFNYKGTWMGCDIIEYK